MLIEILNWNPEEAFRDFVYGTPFLDFIMVAICIFLTIFFFFLVIHEMPIQSINRDRKVEE